MVVVSLHSNRTLNNTGGLVIKKRKFIPDFDSIILSRAFAQPKAWFTFRVPAVVKVMGYQAARVGQSARVSEGGLWLCCPMQCGEALSVPGP